MVVFTSLSDECENFVGFSPLSLLIILDHCVVIHKCLRERRHSVGSLSADFLLI